MRNGIRFDEERSIIHIHYADKADRVVKAQTLADSLLPVALGKVTAKIAKATAEVLHEQEVERIKRVVGANKKEEARLLSLLETPEYKKRLTEKAKNKAALEMATSMAAARHAQAIEILKEAADKVEKILTLEQ